MQISVMYAACEALGFSANLLIAQTFGICIASVANINDSQSIMVIIIFCLIIYRTPLY